MNKKAEGLGGTIFFIFLIILGVYFMTNYVHNNTEVEMFESCETYCINLNQSYVGIDNVETEDKICVCENNSYKIYRDGLTNYKIMFDYFPEEE